MSRSRKKSFILKDQPPGKRHMKRQANRRVRHAKDIPDGKSYKRLYESWDICDYACELDKPDEWPYAYRFKMK